MQQPVLLVQVQLKVSLQLFTYSPVSTRGLCTLLSTIELMLHLSLCPEVYILSKLYHHLEALIGRLNDLDSLLLTDLSH